MRSKYVSIISVATGIALIAAIGTFATIASATTTPTTNPATTVTSTDATLNGTNGDTAATDSSFWVSTSTFSTATPTPPENVYSTADLGAQPANASYSAMLSSATGLPAVTPDTTYFFTSWTEVGGQWSPGAVLSFTTVSSPTITTISPASGSTAGGTPVTITGTDFNSGATVTVGGAAATNVVVNGDGTSLTATTPAGTSGAEDVTVTNTDTGTVTSTGGFTYTVSAPPAAPMVTAITPTSGSTAGGTMVTITGTGLTGATAVDFGGTPATDVTASSSAMDTSLTATSPATTTAGMVDVTVTTSGGTSSTSSVDQFTYTTPAAPAAPVISNIKAIGTGTSTATISWTTDVPASSQVAYGTTSSYGASSTLDTTAVTSHSVTLSNLDEAMLYHFDVNSSDSTGTTTSADNEFVTQSTSSTTPLAIDGIDTTQSSGIADNSFADGWQWVIHFTVPDNENAFRIRFSDWGNASNSFPTAGNVMISSPESSNASTTNAAITENDNGYSDWIYLNGDTATTTAGRQIDLTVQVKIPFGTPNGSYNSNFTAQTYPSTATSTAI